MHSINFLATPTTHGKKRKQKERKSKDYLDIDRVHTRTHRTILSARLYSGGGGDHGDEPQQHGHSLGTQRRCGTGDDGDGHIRAAGRGREVGGIGRIAAVAAVHGPLLELGKLVLGVYGEDHS